MDEPEPAGLVVLVSNRQSIEVDEDGLSALAGRTLRSEGRRRGELSISFVTSEEIETLHRRYMDEPGPTDVLAFPGPNDGFLGDIVVSVPYAARQARRRATRDCGPARPCTTRSSNSCRRLTSPNG